MRRLKSIALSLFAAVGSILTLGLSSAPAQAQATRTFVSGVGDDVNPCSRTAPCKTFAGAISKTAANGEINCLDPGGFGTVTITKSITIDCTGTFGSVLNSGGINGIVINDSLAVSPGTSKVRLRGLTINGAGTTPGLNGIRFIRGASLTVVDVFIQNQTSGSGISIAPSAGTALVNINNTVIANCGNVSTGGIDIRPTGSGFARVTLRNVQVLNSVGVGLRSDSTGTTGLGVLASVDNSEFSDSGQGGIFVNAANVASPFDVMTLSNSNVSNNTTSGIATNGSGARVRVADTVISLNANGVITGTGFINDAGGNRLTGNTTDGTFN